MTLDRLDLLLIDDNPDDRALVLRALRREFPGAEATEIKDAESFAEALVDSRFNLVITDFQLNWTTGLDLLPILKTRFPECPVIMFTATGNEEIAVQAMKAGLDDYVLKSPRHFVHLTAAAKSIMQREDGRRRAELSEARLKDLLSRLNVGVYRTAPDGRLLYGNPAFLAIFGMRSSAEAADWDLERHVVHPEEHARLRAELEKKGRARIPELRLRGPEETEKWVSLALSATFANGNVNAIEGLIEDITERKQLERALRGKEEELRQAQKLESIGRLAGGVAHDFNNLLTAINGYSEILLDTVGAGNPIHEDLVQINKAGSKAASLTRELLAFSRRQILQPEILDLNEIIVRMENPVRSILGGSIQLKTRLSSSLGKVKADPEQLEIVIKNLACNAKDAIAGEGYLLIETNDVEIDAGDLYKPSQSGIAGVTDDIPAGSYVRLTVEDSGMGMDAETLSRIFEPFFTTKPIGKGSGMGLSMVYGMVRQSGGYIFVRSQPGKGTRFHLYLPGYRVPDQAFSPDRRLS